jgi:hypothetical protein
VREIARPHHLVRSSDWLSICARGGIDVLDARVEHLLAFLHVAGFGPERFVVRSTTEAEALEARLAFRAEYTVLPGSELVEARRGRSATYVLLLTKGVSGDCLSPGKASEMRALKGLLIAACAYRMMLEKGQ